MRRLNLAVTAVLLLVTAPLSAADWPTWRHDAGRSAATDETLPAELHLAWSRQLPSPLPAWPEDPRLGFDRVPEPVVAGHTLFVASNRNDSLIAVDTRTGNVTWRFFAEAPIRFAPLIAGDKVVFAADDGCLYAVSAASGKLAWKFNAAPTVRKVIGNDRLISVWPIRGGPVLDGDRVRFTVGIWPFEGNFLYAVDVGTGQLAADKGPDVAVRTLKDLTPQGYLAVTGRRLYIPCGRAIAAGLDLSTGKSLSYSYSTSRVTSYHVSAIGPWLFHGAVSFDTANNRQLPISGRQPVLTSNTVFVGENGAIAAYDLAHPQLIKSKDRKGKTVTRLVLPKRWNLANAGVQKVPAGAAYKKFLAASPLLVDLKAGSRLYGHQGGLLFSVDPPADGQAARVGWKATVKGTPASMIAADGRLFVSTREGWLHCFSGERTTPKTFAFERAKQTTDPVAVVRAASILKTSGAREGFALVLGIGSGDLIEALTHQSDLRLICIDPDPLRVAALRRRLDQRAHYGHRVHAITADPFTCGLPPYLANLVTSERLDWLKGPDANQRLARLVFTCLRPYGGTAMLPLPGDGAGELVEQVKNAKLAGAVARVEGDLAVIRRQGKLPGSADWTHEYGDPSNSLTSADQLVRAPLGVLWFGGPASDGSLFYNRHYWGPSMAVINGRMFLQGPGKLTAVDVYTGRIMWQIPLVDDDNYRAGRRGNDFEKVLAGFHFLAVEDGLYLVHKKNCLRIDPATGKQVSTFTLPDPKSSWGRIRVEGDLLIATVHRELKDRGRQPVEIRVLDRHTGKTIWNWTAERTVPLVAVSGGRLFCLDGHLEGLFKDWARRGLVPKSEAVRHLKAFDLKTGKPLWKYTTDLVVTWLNYSREHDVLMASNKKGMVAYRGKDGGELWRKYSEGKGFRGHPESYWDRVIVLGGRVIDQRGPGAAYDILTGEASMRVHPITGKQVPWEFTKSGHHCNYAIASPHLLTFRAASAGFTDIQSGNTARLDGFRSGCRNSLIPANGVLNAPNFAHGCVCGYSVFTSLAFTHLPQVEMWSYSALKEPSGAIRRVGINLGAPGDRLDKNGTLWLDYPNIGGSSPLVRVQTVGATRTFRQHASLVSGSSLTWVAASGLEGLESIAIRLDKTAKTKRPYTVRLHFAEPGNVKPGERVFDVRLDGRAVLEEFDVTREAAGRNRAIVREFKGVSIGVELTIGLVARTGKPLLCGVEIVAE